MGPRGTLITVSECQEAKASFYPPGGFLGVTSHPSLCPLLPPSPCGPCQKPRGGCALQTPHPTLSPLGHFLESQGLPYFCIISPGTRLVSLQPLIQARLEWTGGCSPSPSAGGWAETLPPAPPHWVLVHQFPHPCVRLLAESLTWLMQCAAGENPCGHLWPACSTPSPPCSLQGAIHSCLSPRGLPPHCHQCYFTEAGASGW